MASEYGQGRVFFLGVRVNATERDALERLARIGGDVALSAVVRALLRREAQRRGVWPVQERAAEEVTA